MPSAYESILTLTGPQLSDGARAQSLYEFATALRWQPSDHLETPWLTGFANAHLVVQHGLENTAVLTFLHREASFPGLAQRELQRLLSVSYNNLVDWHIFVESSRVTYVFNRSQPARVIESVSISRDDYNAASTEAFEQITGRRPNPNLPALDKALIDTVSYWKRLLATEVPGIRNTQLSSLFNAIIFIRAAEDMRRRHAVRGDTDRTSLLLDCVRDQQGDHIDLSVVIRRCADDLGLLPLPEYLIDFDNLRPFAMMRKSVYLHLATDFYFNKFAPYNYDFFVMSKHALSRIYEHYVSILRTDEKDQLSLIPDLPREENDKAFGSVYTPEFIARFFADFLHTEMPHQPGTLRVIDPACGSGIFLRTLLEVGCDPLLQPLSHIQIGSAFNNSVGIDRDENACHAARLSLALLHLVLTERLPDNLDVRQGDALDMLEENPGEAGTYDAVIANPPFVATPLLTPDERQKIRMFLGDEADGRQDLYLAFVKLAVDLIKPGGLALLVLPHTFLLNRHAESLRAYVLEHCWIRCLADLSAIRVFEKVGSYVILLVLQKKTDVRAPQVTVIRAQDLVGRALYDASLGRETANSSYSVFSVSQSDILDSNWIPLPPRERNINQKLSGLPTLGDYVEVRQGFNTGAHGVYVIPSSGVPAGEEAVFKPYLADKEMKPYVVPERTAEHVFYPYVDGRKIEEDELSTHFPRTWQRLLQHRRMLEDRRSVQAGNIPWWQPERPRAPQHMLRPKVVTPHLVLVPRFSIDVEGKYAIARSPLFLPRDQGVGEDILKVVLAVLNSSVAFWHLRNHSPAYQNGYIMLETKILSRTPIPNFQNLSASELRNLVGLVDARLTSTGREAIQLEQNIDRAVSDAYRLSEADLATLGIDR